MALWPQGSSATPRTVDGLGHAELDLVTVEMEDGSSREQVVALRCLD